ncbi:MAG: 3-oxoacyl-ACP reductase [Myxococcales bacterium]|nr:3-oxoacyl-ACP reductase [Myxococcales bacterium]
MSDMLVELSANPWFKQAVKQLGLPIPTPQKLARAKGARVARPLQDRTIVVDTAIDGQLDAVVAETLAEAGADPHLVGLDEVPESWRTAGEAFGRPARLVPLEAPEDARVHGIVLDASTMKAPADLRRLYDVLHGWLPRLRSCGRVIVLGRPPEKSRDPAEAATRAGLDAFVRSVAREIGRKGATAHVVYVTGRAEKRLPALLRFLLSERSAFITGQPWRLSSAVEHKADPVYVRPLEGKVALVTGAARGIGAATAATLAAEGAKVICLDRPGDEEATAKIAQKIGGRPLMVDITAADAPAQIREVLQTEFGGVDIVVHNAGITRDKTLARMKPEQWDQAIDVNLGAILRINDALLEDTLRDGGRVVCLSSVAGLAGNVGQTNYAASKAGVAGYVRALAPTLSRRGIAVNAIAPGFIETRLTAAIPAVTREVGRRMSALGQGGLPEDVAELCTFLCTPDAAGLSGEVVRVCGGLFIGA